MNPPCEPASRFVAQFIGDTNFLEGRVTHEDGELSLLDAGTGCQVRLPKRLDRGSQAMIAVRPEDIALQPCRGAAQGPNQVRGTVQTVLYKGFISHVCLDAGLAKPLKISVQNRVGESLHPRYAPGQSLLATWNDASNIVVESPRTSPGKQA